MLEVSVTEFRSHIPEYLGKLHEGENINLLSRGKVVARILPPVDECQQAREALLKLRGTVIRFDDPCEPAVPPEEWNVLK